METRTIAQKLRHAARFSTSPVFSLFSVSSCGEYTLLLRCTDPEELAREFEAAAPRDETWGLEARCNGRRVEP